MASTPLSTRTVNYLDLIGNGRAYRVPPYQRDYSWGEDQWEDLWQDTLELGESADHRHYLGAIVVQGISDREFLVIDGQQRLATLAVLALAVIYRLQVLAAEGIDGSDNAERALNLRSRFIGDKDPASLIEHSKLTLNETDNGIFQDYLVQGKQPPNPSRLPKSNGLLLKAFDYFSNCIEADTDVRNDGKRLALLLAETVARGFLFILITVEDDLSAYTVFETLNARGLELSTTDLLKNYLFSQMSSGDLDHLQRRWKSLISITTQEKFPEFLRYHMLCSHRKIRKERLFKAVRAEVRNGAEVLQLLEQLELRAELYSAIDDPYHSFWNERPEIRPLIKQLKLFRVKQVTPLIFASYEALEPQVFAQVMRMLVVISFRHSVVGALNGNDLEPVYSEAAIAVLSGEAKSASAVFELSKSVYVSDEKFRQDFALMTSETGGARKGVTRYILMKLESDAAGKQLDYETDPASIEHILPENPVAAWAGPIPEQKWDDYIYRLGNLTPLETSANRELGNSAYEVKARTYAESSYELTRQVARDAPDEWTISHIDKRQSQMALRAVHLWRCDL